jgi:hypothetical protein
MCHIKRHIGSFHVKKTMPCSLQVSIRWCVSRLCIVTEMAQGIARSAELALMAQPLAEDPDNVGN